MRTLSMIAQKGRNGQDDPQHPPGGARPSLSGLEVLSGGHRSLRQARYRVVAAPQSARAGSEFRGKAPLWQKFCAQLR